MTPLSAESYFSQNTFISSFCEFKQFDESELLWSQFAFKSLTPCVEEIVILGSMHVVMILFGMWRLLQLIPQFTDKSSISLFHRLPKSLMDKCILFANGGVVFTTVLQLNARLGQTATTGSATDSTIAPYELVSFTLTMAAWSISLAVACIQYFKLTLATSGTWIFRFLWLFSWSCQTIKLYFNVTLSEVGKQQHGYFYFLYMTQYVLIAFLGLAALGYYPTSTGETTSDTETTKLLEKIKVVHLLNSEIESPEATTSWISMLTFNWMSGLMKTGFERPLNNEDVWNLNSRDTTSVVNSKFEKTWEKECENSSSPSLLRAIISAFGFRYALSGAVKLFNDASQFAGPLLLNLMIKFVGDPSAPTYIGFCYAALLFCSNMIGAFGEGQYFQIAARVGIQVRSALMGSIFRKAMVQSSRAMKTRSSGQVNNIMSQDCESIQLALTSMHNLWSAPFRIVTAIYLLFQQLGWATMAGVFVLIISMPLQRMLVAKQQILTKLSLKAADKRIQLSTEVLSSMNIVKLYAWEESFREEIKGLREDELDLLMKSAKLRAWLVFAIRCVPVLVSVSAFAFFSIVSGKELTPAIAFTSLSLFDVLRMPLITLPNTLSSWARMNVAFERIQDFLQSESLTLTPRTKASSTSFGISIKNGTFTWKDDDTTESATLSNINLQVAAGELCTVIGRTGEGKSSLISAILGDMQAITSGADGKNCVSVSGTVAYVPQQSWIFSGSIRDNILFGKEFNESRYWEAVVGSCLVHDLKQMDDGDETEIGEKGVNLSGGQKQRVSIARAIYSDADVYLLDDPLSALDAHVAQEVFEKAIVGMLKSKTIVFATNRTEFAPSSDRIVVLEDKNISLSGTYAELKNELSGRGLVHKEASSSSESRSKNKNAGEVTVQQVKSLVQMQELKNQSLSKGLIQKEDMERGEISMTVINVYVKALGGKFYLYLILALYFATEAFRVGSSYWVSFWSANSLHLAVGTYISVYAALSFSQTLLTLVNQLLLFIRGVFGGRVLHEGFITGLLKAPMRFFNATPVGRIVNRLTNDIGNIDRQLIFNTTLFVGGLVQIIGTLTIIGTTTYYALASFVPILCVFYWVQRYFQATSREVKRLDSVTRSPIYNHFGQCLNGLSSIRAYRAQDQMYEKSAELIDNHIRLTICNFGANRWLMIRLELLGALMILVSAVVATLMRNVLPSQVAALSLSYALQITGLLNMVVRLASMAENSFNAVERMHEYAQVESESQVGRFIQKSEWPVKGTIEFKSVVATYRPDLPPILKGLSFSVSDSEKVGIVGRTGAGKSTLLLTIFRIMELTSGKIIIDGVDISTLALRELRRKISIIPQDPVLFSGTVRSNLDPFHSHSDTVLWEALKKAHLKDIVSSNGLGLDMEVSDNGLEFSVGQRQLLCLARALVRQSKILVLDEATAAVDTQTDSLIQQTIRSEFKNCTMLTIAHRLNTIIDSDRVLVMDAGSCVEFDTPAALLSSKGSIFSSMVDNTGPENASFLRSVAKNEVDYAKTLQDGAELAKKKL